MPLNEAEWCTPPQHADNDDNSESGSTPDSWLGNRQRSRSFSEAEEMLNHQYYESSFAIAPKSPTNGLHHRPVRQQQSPQHRPSQLTIRTKAESSSPSRRHWEDPFRTPTPKRKPLQYPPGINTSWKRTRFVKWFLVVGFSAYLFLLFRTSLWLLNPHHHFEITHRSMGPSFRHQQDPYAPKIVLRRATRIEMEERARQRRDRTTPPQVDFQEFSQLSWYPITQMNQRPYQSTLSKMQIATSSLAPLRDICGSHAKNSSLADPKNFPSNAALNSRARVLITGILTPLGFNLALYLKESCGVEVIAGLDIMYPNTVQNRLQLQDRIQLLTTNIPKLMKPILVPYLGLDPRSKQGSDRDEIDLLSLNPTHIVHLASYSNSVHSKKAIEDPMLKNYYSPYVTDDYTPNFFPLRTNMISMEQILQNLARSPPEERPHFLYASSSLSALNHPVQATSKLIDEIMAETYAVPSIALRLPNAIYGPWGQAGDVIHDMVETTIQRLNSTTSTLTDAEIFLSSNLSQGLDLVYVDDAAEAIVAAMQYQPAYPIAVEMTSGIETSLNSTEVALTSFFRPITAEDSSNQLISRPPSLNKILEQLYVETHQSKEVHVLDRWVPLTSIRDGLLRTVAWHLDRDAPFGASSNKRETGDDFLKRHGQATCGAQDLICHKGRHYLPCVSECNTRSQCLQSIFDEVKDLIYSVTQGCDMVLYTQSLGYNVKDLTLHSEYMDDGNLRDDQPLLCNFAFVPSESDLVTLVTEKVPVDQLGKFGIEIKHSDDKKTRRKRKLDGLNGRLLYRGWILVWVPNAMQRLSDTDKSLLKLSPGKLFAPEVKNVLFVEENFSVSPNIEDVQFLVGELRRKAFPKRTVKKEVKVPVGSHGHQVIKKKKLQLPPEPPRRAAMLFAPLRYPKIDALKVHKDKNGVEKLTILDATKFMRYEIGMDPLRSEPPDIRRQREFYERISSYVNGPSDLRSNSEPLYRYVMRHWVRTRWVIHDLDLEEGRLLRCDWYQEHVQWGAPLEQLSFAHVMATREVKRRMAHKEPDDRVKTFFEVHRELKDLTDSYEWHALETETNKLYREPVGWISHIPDHLDTQDEKDHDDQEAVESLNQPVPLFVRIMSERIMAASRKLWTKRRKQLGNQEKR